MQMKEGEDIDKYVASVDSLIKARNASIDKLCLDAPTLSTRFNKYKKGSILWQLANDLNNAKFYCPKYNLPESAKKYIHDTFWTHIETPYTLHYNLTDIISSYITDVGLHTNSSTAKVV